MAGAVSLTLCVSYRALSDMGLGHSPIDSKVTGINFLYSWKALKVTHIYLCCMLVR